MNREASILVVDDEEGARVSIARILEPADGRVQGVGSAEEALAILPRESFDLVLCDIRLNGIDGLELQRRIHSDFPEIPVIMITAYGAVETAVKALKQGAYDYITKPFSGEELRAAVRRALENRRLKLENDSLREAVQGSGGGEVWIGDSPVMKRLYAQAAPVAQSQASVFLSGESGTGKEILARYIHAHSPRSRKVFVALNCAALSETLADSQLFGHDRGAFTGAVKDQRGYLEMAHGGTLFLDEIVELRPEVQAKLLRVLEEHRLRRLGSEREIPVDVRILAAAQKEPEQLVREGRLREDLFFRLGAVHLRVPPLRERIEDVHGLAIHFLAQLSRELKKPIAGLDREALTQLEHHSWPGNVRELKNVLERASIFVEAGEVIGIRELPEKLRHTASPVAFTVPAAPPPSLDAVSRSYIEFVLQQCEGNQAKAARLLGIAPSTLWRHRSTHRPDSGTPSAPQ